VGHLAGQEGGLARLEGTVWDSLAGRPLAGAEVVLGPGLARATADRDGTFALEASPGRYTLVFSHPDVPEWAIATLQPRVALGARETTRIRLGTRSARTVLDQLCGGRGGLVGGRVRDLLTLVPLSAASVDVQVEAGAAGSSTQTARASGSGAYHLCLGTPAGLEVRARLGTEQSRALPARVEEGSVTVRDLFIQLSEPARLVGLVRDADSGRPLADAAVRVVGTRLGTFTGEDGRFAFRGVPPGEVSLAVELLGYGERVADLRADEGARVEVTLDLFPEAIALDSMVVSVRGATSERVRGGARYDGLDRPAIEALLPRSVGFDDLLRNANVPGLRIREGQKFPGDSGLGAPGLCVETGRSSTIEPGLCQMVEVYVNDVRVAEAENFLLALDPGTVDSFRLLSRTAAGVQYGGTPRARNGVLLIYTRGR
jgi:protocatechuate 3,4-dioxygenase beta subunit